MTTKELIHDLDTLMVELHSRLLEMEAMVGEIKLREKGLNEIGGSLFVVPDERLPAGFRRVNGEVVYSAEFLNDKPLDVVA